MSYFWWTSGDCTFMIRILSCENEADFLFRTLHIIKSSIIDGIGYELYKLYNPFNVLPYSEILPDSFHLIELLLCFERKPQNTSKSRKILRRTIKTQFFATKSLKHPFTGFDHSSIKKWSSSKMCGLNFFKRWPI